jgi:hypothetical protein
MWFYIRRGGKFIKEGDGAFSKRSRGGGIDLEEKFCTQKRVNTFHIFGQNILYRLPKMHKNSIISNSDTKSC